MSRRRGRALVAVAVLAAALFVAACGGRDDFENEPRPPVPAELTVKIGDGEVVVSPRTVGAGLVNFQIANFEDSPAVLAIEGPTEAVSEEIAPRGSNTLKTELATGSYQVSADGVAATPFTFEVGPERESGQNDLLLP
jgi:hypothetical protein